ncbi:unnamed protein product [Urochloa humidicola]
MEPQQDLTRLIPDDVLAGVLRRVAPRDLAALRCICKAWRTLIDGRGLLRADLLPRSLTGLFICYKDLPYPELFLRPSADFAKHRLNRCVEDHCSGLLLHYDCVVNPATGGRLPLPERPPPPAGMECFFEYEYLAFDPTVSSDYEVYSVPSVPLRFVAPPLNGAVLQSEWPPSLFTLSVLSSRTRQWEERRLIREGDAAGTVADMQLDGRDLPSRHAVCWHGALYVHQQTDFVMRISLSNHTYRVIKPPTTGIEMFKRCKLHLGRSQNGVYCALLDDEYRLWAWVLDESCGQMEWVLRHDSSHGLPLPSLNCDQRARGPWILENINCDDGDIDVEQEQVEQEFEWDSDCESIHHTEFQDRVGKHGDEWIEILGFHPFKETIFLQRSCYRGLAYHLKSSRLEDLGNLYPKNYNSVVDHVGYIIDAFPYTPCWMGEFPENMESWAMED